MFSPITANSEIMTQKKRPLKKLLPQTLRPAERLYNENPQASYTTFVTVKFNWTILGPS